MQLAAKIAAHSINARLVTSVCQLVLCDMRAYAGKLVQVQIPCGGRMMLGVGKRAFAARHDRMEVKLDQTRAWLAEPHTVLKALLTHNDVSFDGTFYSVHP